VLTPALLGLSSSESADGCDRVADSFAIPGSTSRHYFGLVERIFSLEDVGQGAAASLRARIARVAQNISELLDVMYEWQYSHGERCCTSW